MKAQRALAVLLTVGLFGLVIFGMGALFALFDQRVWGYAAGGVACAVMVGSAFLGARHAGGAAATGPGPGRPGGTGQQSAARRPTGTGRAGGAIRSSGRSGGSSRPGGAARPGRSGRR